MRKEIQYLRFWLQLNHISASLAFIPSLYSVSTALWGPGTRVMYFAYIIECEQEEIIAKSSHNTINTRLEMENKWATHGAIISS